MGDNDGKWQGQNKEKFCLFPWQNKILQLAMMGILSEDAFAGVMAPCPLKQIYVFPRTWQM